MLNGVDVRRWNKLLRHFLNVFRLIDRDREVIKLINRHAEEIVDFAKVFGTETLSIRVASDEIVREPLAGRCRTGTDE